MESTNQSLLWWKQLVCFICLYGFYCKDTDNYAAEKLIVFANISTKKEKRKEEECLHFCIPRVYA